MRVIPIPTTVEVIVFIALFGTLMALLNYAVGPSSALAHGGGLDRYGCHRDNKVGSYHCHRGPCGGKTFESQGEMLKAACASGK